MNKLYLLGLVLLGIPACLSENNDKHCFSEPTYPCCSDNIKIIYTDDNGNWGLENGDWCGIIDKSEDDSSKTSSDACFSIAEGYPCCVGDKVVYSDERGDWGVENGKWCGIGFPDSCLAATIGYPCCEACNVLYSDERGDWGVEDQKWCGIKYSCNNNNSTHVDDTDIDTSVDIKAEPMDDFELTFLKLERDKKKNMVYSPLSIEYALRMLQEGAKGKTFTEINNVVGNSDMTKYANFEENLSLANGLFVKDTQFKYVKEQYIKLLKEKYDAEIVNDSFNNAKNVNQWIEEKTLGMIKNLLEDRTVQENIMLIVNALAIDMEWDTPFYPGSTYSSPFYKEDGDILYATTMSHRKIRDRSLGYFEDSNITVLNLDLKKYNSTQLEFMAIMPKKEKLSDYIENVTMEQINEIYKNINYSSNVKDGVYAYIPRFKYDYDLSLKDDLEQLGIKTAFNKANADFSKIADYKESGQFFYVSEAIHKALIDFREKGTKAAAVTVIGMTAAKALPEKTYPVYIYIDRPFMYLIKDKNTNDVWFVGTVYEPNLWENDKSEYMDL